MTSGTFKCPQCGKKSTIRGIAANNYACSNSNCELSYKLLIHCELTTNGKVSKLYGWVLQPGTILKKKYEIVKMIGKGGFGATYLAKDHSMFGQIRAIKEIPRAFCDDKEDQFLTVLSHASIPKLYERFNIGKFHYSVMEFIEGKSLEAIVKKDPHRLSEKKVLYFARQLCDVVEYIHSRKVVHRDLKPENVLVRKDNSIVLIDFGIAKQHAIGHGTRHLARAASYGYSSPEQYQTGKGFTDYPSDVYSLGAILYFLATGVEPIDALSRDPHGDIKPLPKSLNPGISARLQYVIIKAMKMSKAERFQDAGALKAILFGNGITKSKKICAKCKALLEPGNRFCPNCGSSTQPVHASGALSQPKSGKRKNKRRIATGSDFNFMIKTTILFLLIFLIIGYLGPEAKMSLPRPWVMLLFGSVLGIMNARHGLTVFVVALLLGSSLGAMMNIVAQWIYPLLNTYLMLPVLTLFSMMHSEKTILAGWGIFGLYVGGSLGICSKLWRRKKN